VRNGLAYSVLFSGGRIGCPWTLCCQWRKKGNYPDPVVVGNYW